MYFASNSQDSEVLLFKPKQVFASRMALRCKMNAVAFPQEIDLHHTNLDDSDISASAHLELLKSGKEQAVDYKLAFSARERERERERNSGIEREKDRQT